MFKPILVDYPEKKRAATAAPSSLTKIADYGVYFLK